MKKIRLMFIFCSLISALPVTAGVLPALGFKIEGVKGDELHNVESRLAVERRELDSHIDAISVVDFSRASISSVKHALAPFGYYDPEVRTDIQHQGESWVIVYKIDKGIPVRITSIDVTVIGPGADDKKIKNFERKFPLKVGAIFNSNDYSAARDKLFDVVSNEGYIKAVTSDSKVLVNTDHHTAAIKLHVNTHERYYFGKITFNKTAYDPAFMQRFDIFREDQPFSSNELLQYQQDMNSSRYFKQVLIIPDMEGDSNYRVPIDASVVPVNQRRYDAGLGYGTFTGPRLTAGVNFRRLTDTGQSLDAQLKLSSVLSGLAVKYYIPGRNPLTEQWILGANYQKFVPKNGYSHSKSVTFGYTKKMKRWTVTANINYLWERYKVAKLPNRDSELLYPALNLSYLKTDNIVQPTYGRLFNITLQGGSTSVFSTTSFLQTKVSGKLFMTPFSFGHIILRGEAGYTLVHELNKLPLSMRFFAGGMTSIRGFPDQSIGPGKYLGVASIEYRHHLIYDFSGAVFYDVGTATNHFGQPLNRGAGVGLVYESIVGPIKIYAARALSKHGDPYQFEFSMGPEF